MSITTYAELQTAIADFLNRDDLTSVVPTFIALAEADISRRLRHWQMEARDTLSFSGQFTSIPADWVETIRLYATGDGTFPIEMISRAEMLERRSQARDVAGKPTFYTMSAGQFEVFPTPSDTYSADLLYYSKIPALSVSNTSNWLLSEAPDVYLYGALIHSAPYLQDDARLAVWASLYQSSLDALGMASDAAKYSGSGLRMRIKGA